MPTKTVLLSLLAAAMLPLTGCDCGDDDDDASGDGDADADGDGDGDGDADADTDGDGDGDGDADCGEDPCASHQGEQSFVEEGAPADAADTFDGGAAHPAGTDADREPHILYPSHETMFPLNISRIRHEWRAGSGATLYELSFVGPNTTVRVFTRTTDWLPSDEEWDWIAESNRGEAVVWTVRGLDEAAPGDVWVSQSVTLYFSRAAVLGAIYYWSTGSQGIMKGLPASAIPSKFFTDPAAADAQTCTACHSLSRDGTRLAVGYGGEKLWEVSVPERERILPVGDEQERESSWTTFSPDGSMILVARDGDLTSSTPTPGCRSVTGTASFRCRPARSPRTPIGRRSGIEWPSRWRRAAATRTSRAARSRCCPGTARRGATRRSSSRRAPARTTTSSPSSAPTASGSPT